jgi:hypothetical protein
MPVESDYPVPGASTKALPVDVNVLYLSANDRGQRVSYRHNALIDNEREPHGCIVRFPDRWAFRSLVGDIKTMQVELNNLTVGIGNALSSGQRASEEGRSRRPRISVGLTC